MCACVCVCLSLCVCKLTTKPSWFNSKKGEILNPAAVIAHQESTHICTWIEWHKDLSSLPHSLLPSPHPQPFLHRQEGLGGGKKSSLLHRVQISCLWLAGTPPLAPPSICSSCRLSAAFGSGKDTQTQTHTRFSSNVRDARLSHSPTLPHSSPTCQEWKWQLGWGREWRER